MKPLTLSPSSLGLFLECPRCFWLDKVKGIKRPSGAFPSLPAGMDRILKAHFDEHRKNGKPPEELEGKFKGHLFQDMEKLNIWRNNFKGLQYRDPKSGIILRGAIDELFVTADNKHDPLDFKTRGYPRKEDTHEHYQHQMDIYSYLLSKNGMKPVGFAILIFYHPVKINEQHHVEFDPDPVKVRTNPERGSRIFLDAVDCLLLEEEPEPSESCDWCAFGNE